MQFRKNILFLVSCFVVLAFGVVYARDFPNEIHHNIQSHDQVTYFGKIVNVEANNIVVNIFGPGCAGVTKFKRDNWRQQVSYKEGDVVTFALSGECSDDKSVLTVESRR